MFDVGMDAKDRMKLLKNYANLIEVMYMTISPHLISKLIIDLDMHAEIESKPTDRKKMEKLLAILPTRGKNAMKEFIASLKPNYGWLAMALEQDENNNSKDNYKDKCGGKVDVPISKHTREVERIMQKNMQLCQKWTALAGEMGIKASTVVDIKREMYYSGGLDFAIQRLLESWEETYGNKATFSQLIHHLQKVNFNNCAEDIEELWESL